MLENENNVILAVLKLSRALRRCSPAPAGHPGPEGRDPESRGPERKPGHRDRREACAPAIGRLLACVAEHPRVSSRDLCEMLDLRPSSLSEMLARADSDGWIFRTVDEEDRRIQRVDLSPKGKAYMEEMEKARREDLERKTACFTEEEKAQFCALCNRLSDHLESLALDLPPRPDMEPAPDREPVQGPKHRRPFPPEGRLRC